MYYNLPRYLTMMVAGLVLHVFLIACGGNEAATPTIQPEEPEVPTPTTTVADSQTVLRFELAEDGQQIQIWADEVTNLYAVDMMFTFDATLNIADSDADKDGLQILPGEAPVPDFVAVNTVDQTNQSIKYVATQLAPRESFNGNALIATIQLTDPLTELSDNLISVNQLQLANDEGQPINITTQP